MDETLLLTIDQARAKLQLGRSTVYGLVMRGELSSLTIGRSRRIPAWAVERFIRERVERDGMLA